MMMYSVVQKLVNAGISFAIVSLLLFTNNSYAAQSYQEMQEELRQIGALAGYAGACLKAYNLNGNEQEDSAFAKIIKKRYIQLGNDFMASLTAGAGMGISQASTDGYVHCKPVLQNLISIYQSVGLTGNHIKSALNKMR